MSGYAFNTQAGSLQGCLYLHILLTQKLQVTQGWKFGLSQKFP